MCGIPVALVVVGSVILELVSRDCGDVGDCGGGG